MRTLALRLALYPISVRRLLGFATPLPPLLSLLTAACGSLHLAVTTRDGTFTRKNCAMPGTRMNPLFLNGKEGFFMGSGQRTEGKRAAPDE